MQARSAGSSSNTNQTITPRNQQNTSKHPPSAYTYQGLNTKPRGPGSSSSIGSETSNASGINRRIPVTPSVMRSIFASSRTVMEERSISRVAFFRFAGFVLSSIMISVLAARNRGRPAIGMLGIV